MKRYLIKKYCVKEYRKEGDNLLTPAELEALPKDFTDLYSELEQYIIKDYCKRVKKVGKVTSSAQWMQERADLLGIHNIEEEVAKTLKLSKEKVDKIFPDLAEKSLKQENEIYVKAKLSKGATLKGNKELEGILDAAKKQTKGEFVNITNSLGFAVKEPGGVRFQTIQQFFHKNLNLAWVKIRSGVTSATQAVKDAVRKITSSGLRFVDYDSGYSNNIDVAVRRSTMTAAQQMSQQMTDANMDKIIPDKDMQYVEVSAHAGARTGTGVGNHQAWQGRVYKVKGSDKDYPNLEDSTGLGQIQGLKGANCRHSYSVFIPNASVRTYTDEQLKHIDLPPFKYKGKEYTAYEATQQMRKIETAMRTSKREILAFKESEIEDEFIKSSAKLQQQRREYREFAKAANLKQQNARHQVEGFTQSLSKEATAAAKKG